ncbi:MAG: hypothetical protein ACSHYB_17695 [Roseibacillus sp.]
MQNESKIQNGEETSPDLSSPLSAEEPSSPNSSESPELSSVEVLRMDEERMGEITQTPPNSKNSWLPWKRPNRRDQQLRHLREGYIELLGLVRSISGHLDRQKDEKSQVTDLAESLPPALRSFETLADSQKEVTSILGSLNSHMEKTGAKDEQLLENLEGFNSALKEVSSSNEKSLGTLHQVSERIEHSDEQMKMLFEHANQSSQAAGALMVRLEKRVFLSNLALVVLLCLLLLLGMFWVTKKQPPAAPIVVNLPATATQVTPNPLLTEESAVEVTTTEIEEEPGLVEPPIEGVGILGEDVAPSFPTESEDETPEFKVPAILSPELLAPIIEEEEAGAEATAKEEEIEDLDLFEY